MHHRQFALLKHGLHVAQVGVQCEAVVQRQNSLRILRERAARCRKVGVAHRRHSVQTVHAAAQDHHHKALVAFCACWAI